MAQTPLLPGEDPLEALCRHFNVMKTEYPVGQPLLLTFDMPILRDAHMPTHVLAVYDGLGPESTSFRPIMVPVHAEFFVNKFGIDVIPCGVPGSTLPVPHTTADTESEVVTLPVVPLSVPHAPSVPLILLFTLHPKLKPGPMAWWLLPDEVVGEFPHAAAMSQLMARKLTDRRLKEYAIFNQGLWKNTLALGARDANIVNMIQTAWNVTAEARRIRRQYEHGVTTNNAEKNN